MMIICQSISVPRLQLSRSVCPPRRKEKIMKSGSYSFMTVRGSHILLSRIVLHPDFTASLNLLDQRPVHPISDENTASIPLAFSFFKRWRWFPGTEQMPSQV